MGSLKKVESETRIRVQMTESGDGPPKSQLRKIAQRLGNTIFQK